MTGHCDSEQPPAPLIISLRRWVRRTLLRPRRSLYEKLYEAHARKHPDARAIGAKDDDFETLGRIEFEILRAEGLERNTALLDFGCGTGRLAVQTIPYLTGGAYIGVDISPSMLKRAAETVARACPAPSCRVAWVRQPWARFLQDDASVDMICAFSVFTHMEHEDTYLYLKEARRVVRPGGRLVLSCLPMDSALAR
ncbi:MAG: class I SAM-dependent methyltransferase, partial [Candidatus Rokuibacteriota bacterium]